MTPEESIDYIKILYGKDLLRFFENLKKNKTVIKINVLGHSYERLTMVIGVVSDGIPYHFQIDYPRGFQEVIREASPWKIRFEFKANDKLGYRFKTLGGHLSGRDIFIPFPPHIERVQRRRYFRVEAPLGTQIIIPQDTCNAAFTLLNISEGGALIRPGEEFSRRPVFQKGDFLRDIVIRYDRDGEPSTIPLEKAVVQRLERDPLTHRYQYALRFMELEKNVRNNLKELIYFFQRDFLQKRQKVEG
jgi:hypothetical protein